MIVPGTSLSLKSRREHEEPEGLPDCLSLRGEVEWLLEGESSQLLGVRNALPEFCEVLTDRLLILSFGNAIGFFNVPHLGRIKVVSGKWGQDDFDRMLVDLTEVAAGLPFASRITGALPYDRAVVGQDQILYHAFVYLRYSLSSDAPFQDRLLPALAVVLSEPHRLFSRIRRQQQPFLVRRVDARTLSVASSGRHKLVSVPPQIAARVPLAAAFGGRLPEFVDEGQVEINYDTPENRFVKRVLRDALWVIDRVRRIIVKRSISDVFGRRVIEQCDRMEKQLKPIARAPFWQQIGTLTQIPTSSTVLQRRRGYRNVYRHFVKSRLSARVPLSAELMNDLLEAKDIAQLYEIWSYFAVVREVEKILGRPSKAEALTVDAMEVSMRWGFEVSWADGTRVTYNPRFSRNCPSARFSYSVPLRPDIAVEVAHGVNAGLHLFDAKFRLDRIDEVLSETEESEDESDQEERTGTFKRGDLYKMHTYRDSIPRARSVWILYPGDIYKFFSIRQGNALEDGLPCELDGVGAIPIQPGEQVSMHLDDVFFALLNGRRGNASTQVC